MKTRIWCVGGKEQKGNRDDGRQRIKVQVIEKSHFFIILPPCRLRLPKSSQQAHSFDCVHCRVRTQGKYGPLKTNHMV